MTFQSKIYEISQDELDLTHSLTPGQSFRWRPNGCGGWIGVVENNVVRIYRKGNEVHYEAFPGTLNDNWFEDYFRLDVNLSDLYVRFSSEDSRISRKIECFRGLRVLRQEPEETLLSYTCSPANSVKRICSSIEVLSRLFGDYITEVDGKAYYSFPSVERIAQLDGEQLMKLCGLGFRGRNLVCVANQLLEKPDGWLDSMRNSSYNDAFEALLSLKCVGMKIADCTLLCSMDKDQAVPVDTHVRSVAVNDYLADLKQKSLTPAVYRTIADFFREKFGEYAGWAQAYLFYDDLLQPSKECTT